MLRSAAQGTLFFTLLTPVIGVFLMMLWQLLDQNERGQGILAIFLFLSFAYGIAVIPSACTGIVSLLNLRLFCKIKNIEENILLQIR